MQLIASYTADDIARGSLSVDDEVVVAVVVPGVIDQPTKVGPKRVRHLALVDGRTDHSDEIAAGAIRTQFIPGASVNFCLCFEPVTGLGDPVRRKSKHLLVRSIRLLQSEANGDADKVDSRDIGIESIVVDPSQLRKSPVLLRIGIVRVRDGRLYESRAVGSADDVERETTVREPDTGTRDETGQSELRRLTLSAKRNGDVCLDHLRRGRRGARVDPLTVSAKHDQCSCR